MPRNTVDAIETGCRHAQAGAIERMYRAFRELEASPLCIVSGGAGRAIVDQLAMPRRYVQDLVLDGLARIALDERKISLKGELPMPEAAG
jgi:type III pantothenate kinase